MPALPLPTPARLRQLLAYDADSGKFTWLHRPIEEFEDGYWPAEKACETWNRLNAGKPALMSKTGGYLTGKVDGRLLKAHRVAWAIVHGEWPTEIIDHINHNKLDNRLCNLRDVSARENVRNRKPRDGEGLPFGVNWKNDKQRYRARIMVEGKEKHLGYFDTVEEALAARKVAEAHHGW